MSAPGASKPEFVEIMTSGTDFGRALADNEHFELAVGNKPAAALLQICCRPASGPAARESAEALHAAGIKIDVWASKATTYLYRTSHADGMEVEEKGIGTDVRVSRHGYAMNNPWVRFKAPSDSPET
ncbi:hypothetical protein [Nocardia sp. NPDC051463]|uniref:hypothetical protein n=1 Tax=Nocardia sp. NPDC051463 TaxID=3154845 RepID=UPI00344B911F